MNLEMIQLQMRTILIIAFTFLSTFLLAQGNGQGGGNSNGQGGPAWKSNQGSDDIYKNPLEGNVGIGTDSPQVKLHVKSMPMLPVNYTTLRLEYNTGGIYPNGQKGTSIWDFKSHIINGAGQTPGGQFIVFPVQQLHIGPPNKPLLNLSYDTLSKGVVSVDGYLKARKLKSDTIEAKKISTKELAVSGGGISTFDSLRVVKRLSVGNHSIVLGPNTQGTVDNDISTSGSAPLTFQGSGSNNETHINPFGGKVGIGITSPEGKLHIQTSGDEAILIGSGPPETKNRPNSITFTETNTASSGSNGIKWLDGGGSTYTAIYGSFDGKPELSLRSTKPNGTISFYAGNSTSERMCIHPNGSVGIDVQTPQYKLEVGGNIKAQKIIADELEVSGGMASEFDSLHVLNEIKVGTHSLRLGSDGGGTENYIYTDAGPLRINADEQQGTIEHTLINPDGGKVGIGTGNSALNGKLNINSDDDEAIVIGTGMPESDKHNSITFTETNSPNQGDNGIRWLNGGGNAVSAIYGSFGGGEELTLRSTNQSGTITFYTGNSSGKRMHIEPDGKIGINTENPQQRLHVNGNIKGNKVFAEELAIATDDLHGVFTVGGTTISSGIIQEFTSFTINELGQVGINTENPEALLDIHGTSTVGGLRITDDNQYYLGTGGNPGPNPSLFEIRGNSYNNHPTHFIATREGRIGVGTNEPYHGGIHIKNNANWGTPIWLDATNITDGKLWTIQSTGGNHGSGKGKLLIRDEGGDVDGVLITSNPSSQDVKFSVNGLITAAEIRVDLTSFSDYVFNENYPLPPLQDVEKYIQENKHLPNIPSEKEVIENGLDLGQFQTMLLEKIEELTLYTIEQEKRLRRLEEENKRLKAKIRIN